ncbi:actin cross-linking [Artemisia annua]|uniref:Actin cross-linking n=1 Tax=Artemisia annua TaxID=35608 RepID=A0A2U1LI02_ARTAN|nr:actin cross-linking [Artemisia annua]
MELFLNRSTVRLKSCRDKYLFAENDEESVSQCKDGTTRNSYWTVEVVDEDCITLKSCYGKYLTAANKPSIPGMRARYLKVTQTRLGNRNPNDPMRTNDDSSITGKWNSALQWLPVMTEVYSEVRLKTHYGNYLQSNKGPPPLGNMVTHDLPRKEGPMNKRITWQVEMVESPMGLLKESESFKSRMTFYARTFVSEIQKGKERIKGSAKNMMNKPQTSQQ